MREETGERLGTIHNLQVITDVSLRSCTGFKTGGLAAFLAIPGDMQALVETIQLLRKNKEKYYILGNGSNVIAPESRYEGCVIKTEALCEVEEDGDTALYCDAGLTLAKLCRLCADKNLSGLEFAYGIPGTVGGAVFMNAGAYDGEMRDVVTAVRVLDPDGNILLLDNHDMRFGYRTSTIKNSGYIILGARFNLIAGQTTEIWRKMNDFMQRRVSKQPLEYPSCGSTFKRPQGSFASKLIDDCGLRGYAVGDAAVSEKHCGFVINRGKASSDDIFSLIRNVQKNVREQTGYTLDLEIQILE